MTKERWTTELTLAARSYRAARIRRDRWITEARQTGLFTVREISEIVGLSISRINQIARGL